MHYRVTTLLSAHFLLLFNICVKFHNRSKIIFKLVSGNNSEIAIFKFKVTQLKIYQSKVMVLAFPHCIFVYERSDMICEIQNTQECIKKSIFVYFYGP